MIGTTPQDADGAATATESGGDISTLTWEVHKFGGTSLASADCFLRVARIVEGQISSPPNLRVAVVVSAMGATKPNVKVTDLLLSTVRHAAERDGVALDETLSEISDRHHRCMEELGLEEDDASRLRGVIRDDVGDLRDILKTVSLMRWESSRIRELVSGYGELWSAQILAALLRHRSIHRDACGSGGGGVDHVFRYVDARRVITIDEEAINTGAVAWDVSSTKLQEILREEEEETPQTSSSSSSSLSPEPSTATGTLLHLIVTGYVASNTRGVATTLQRDGSDYSASIVGRLLGASSITVWTDVDGVMSADPRRVPEAHVVPEVSYNEAMELAYFGAKVIHPKTMQPAILSTPQIPIYIRNTFAPSLPGSRIFTLSTTHTERDRCVCGFTSIDGMALVNVEGSGLVGVPGVAKRLFETLEGVGASVVLISQASSEHSISFATSAERAGAAKEAIEETFAKELRQNHISAVDVTMPCSIIAAVGDGMSSTAGVSGLFFSALGDARINVIAIAQGSSERNISAVVSTDQSGKALRAVHAAFRLSHATVRVGIVGVDGELGRSLLHLLESQRGRLREAFEVDLQVRAVVAVATDDSVGGGRGGGERRGHLVTIDCKKSSEDSITAAAYDFVTGAAARLPAGAGMGNDPSHRGSVSDFATVEDCTGTEGLVESVVSDDCAHAVIFDCTGDEAVGARHADWLDAGVHVVTANNTGLSGPRRVRDAIEDAERRHGKASASRYLREVAVGGALPVIGTLRDLLNSGDQVRRVDGILSISMSYILHRIAPPPGMADCGGFDESISRGAYRESYSLSPDENNVGVGGCSFSEAVKEAIALGLMEPDPRKDLSNEYTARCLMVLAKELGIADNHEVETIQLASDMLMVDVEDCHAGGAVKKGPADSVDYEEISDQLDRQMHERVINAAKKGCVPRHISSIDVRSGEIDVKIVDVPCMHMFAINPPGCEIVRFFTHRHKRYPLIVQGPAEGSDSTSSALLAELLNLMRMKVGAKTGALTRTESSAFLA